MPEIELSKRTQRIQMWAYHSFDHKENGYLLSPVSILQQVKKTHSASLYLYFAFFSGSTWLGNSISSLQKQNTKT